MIQKPLFAFTCVRLDLRADKSLLDVFINECMKVQMSLQLLILW